MPSLKVPRRDRQFSCKRFAILSLFICNRKASCVVDWGQGESLLKMRAFTKHLQETTKEIVTISLTFSRSCNSRVVDYFDPPCSSCCCKPLQREHSALQSLFHRVAFSEQYRSLLDLTACLKNKPASCLSKLLKQCFAFEEMTLLAEGASLFGSQVLSPSGRLDGSNEQFHKCKFGLRSNLRQV